MPAPIFTLANPTDHYDALLELNLEYVSWVLGQIETMFGITAEELIGTSVAEYVPGVIAKVCGDPPPRGVFYLIEVEGKLAGMCGLRFLREGVGEIKRFYVRPEFRGQKLGETALRRLLTDAHDFGYERVCLDTGPFMYAAQKLYEAQGFTDCAAYEGVEVPEAMHRHWRFMTRQTETVV